MNSIDGVCVGKTMAITIDNKETEQTELEEKSTTMGFRANGAMCIVHSFEPKGKVEKNRRLMLTTNQGLIPCMHGMGKISTGPLFGWDATATSSFDTTNALRKQQKSRNKRMKNTLQGEK